jgi:nucleoside-diphosphate-sugar epimerase
MRSALIGHTGFVGGNLARQYPFDECFNSKDIEGIAGRRFDLIVCSGMPAAKWIANRDPDGDRAVLERLTSCLLRSSAGEVVVISTVDVYPCPVGVDEESPINTEAQQPYGRHRLLLERRVAEHFPSVLSVRLPGLFGPGLKKNAVYDLLYENELHKVNAAGVFQWYNLDYLWKDIKIALAGGLRLVNVATEPVSMRQVAREAFGVEFGNDPGSPPARYDMRSRHAGLYGGRDGYLYPQRQVLAELRQFVTRQRQSV